MLNLLDVNLLVIVISLLLNMGLGMLWYGPLFGKAWMAGAGFKEEDREEMQKSAGIGYVLSALFALLFGYVLDLLFNLIPLPNLGFALVITGLIYVGLVLPNTIKGRLWLETTPSVFRINTGFEIVYFGLMGVVAYLL